ncbi:uncharacterized protein LOC141607670 [Silene latifolia]|uniref:uncharacterized protein LOC141607670 n=1 Tax=Silene latifolia TaxID=37657 RepID=UPI003D7791D0
MASSSSLNPCRAGVSLKLPLHLCADFTGVDFSKALIAKILDQCYLDVPRIYDLIFKHWKLNGATVNIEGSLFVFRTVTPMTIPDNLLFHIVPIWIRVKHLPIPLLNTSVAAFLLSHVGDICEEETYPTLLPTRNFVRVKVWVDLSKPLIPGCYLALNDREHQWIGFSYEGVFRFCKTCGQVGHRVLFCPSGKVRGARDIQSRLDELSSRGLMVLHGPPGSSFYSPDVLGLPPRLKYLNSEINIASPSDPVIVDSGGAYPVFSFSSSPSDEDLNGSASVPPPDCCIHEDQSREVLLENFPLIRGPVVPGPQNAAAGETSTARVASPAFRMTAPDANVDASLDLGLGEPSTPPRSTDVGCLFRDSVTCSTNVPAMDSHGRKIELFSDKFGGTSFIRGQRDFTAWKFSNGLVDLPFFGPRFTWMNSQLHSATIFERLDRAYANQDWCQLFPNASITHLPILVSDHAPIILSLFAETSSRRRPYRIDNWCLAYPEVQQIVKEAWNTPFFGSSMYVVSRKLSSARHSVLQWVRNHRISCGINWSDIEADLDTTADQIIDDQSAMNFVQLRSSRLQLLHTQRQYWIQRSKFTSEILDGFLTKFLYNRVKQRSTKHRILALRSDNGDWLYSSKSIASEIVNYFKALLCRTTPQESNVLLDHIHPLLDGLHLPSLSPLECSILQAPFTEHDVLRALKGMDGSKSPGPDGITPKFF